MSGSELTLGAVLAHLEEQEREIAAQAEATRGRIAELTAQLEEFDRVAEEVRITRKTLLALPDPSPPTPPAAKLPNHPAYRQIMAVFAAADAPLRARAAAGQVHEHDVPGGAFDQGAERRRRPCRCLCGAFADHDHGGVNRGWRCWAWRRGMRIARPVRGPRATSRCSSPRPWT